MRTTSKSLPRTCAGSALSASLSRRSSGAPLTYPLLPLSATSIPQAFVAARIARVWVLESQGIWWPAFSRTRMPIGGRSAPPLLEAQWLAGDS